MVTVEKTMEEKNGRRSVGPSPNGHILSDDSMDSSDLESDVGMKVGDDYQARIPEYNPDVKSDARAEAMLVWAPHPDLTEPKIDEYVLIAKERHGYNMEQALGMLFWHKHNVERALTDLANFTPFPDEWTVEDKVLFEQAFSFHGKSFHRIRQMLPDKSISQLVKYYYSWKKTRSRTSLMDRQARKIIAKDDSDEDSESENEADHKPRDSAKEESKLRPGPASKKYELHPRKNKHKRKPPRGMYLTQDDLLALATGPPAQGDALLKQLNGELVVLKRSVQHNKQMLSGYRVKAIGHIDIYKPPESALKINARWTNDELMLAVLGITKYGKNFKAIAEVLGNKSESHVRSFFVNYRRRYNLDKVLASYEQEHGLGEPIKPEDIIDLDSDEKMDTEDSAADDTKSVKNEIIIDSQDSTPEVNDNTPVKTSQPPSPNKLTTASPSKATADVELEENLNTSNGQGDK